MFFVKTLAAIAMAIYYAIYHVENFKIAFPQKSDSDGAPFFRWLQFSGICQNDLKLKLV